MTRPALSSGAVRLRDDGRVEITTKPDPKTGAETLELDPLDFVAAALTQIPDARKHLVRYCGAYSHRRRATARAANGAAVGACVGEDATIDRILDHRDEAGLVSPFEPRGPPPSG